MRFQNVKQRFKGDVVRGAILSLVVVGSCNAGGATEVSSETIARAGLDQNVLEGDVVSLDASQSSNADNAAMSFEWSQIGGSVVHLNSPDSALVDFTAPETSEEMVLTFQVEVTSADGGSAIDDVNIAVGGAENRVLTDAGFYEGQITPTTMTFKGMPFALPPVQDLRWKAPQPDSQFEGFQSASEFGPSCWQDDGTSLTGFQASENMSEDCLYLNVWTPETEPSSPRPVMVWIHGGSNVNGSSANPLYDGDLLASEQDVVVVSINYRLGAFGYLAHPDLSSNSPNQVSGNYGLQDVLAALQWIDRNIAKFGGDTENITAFGESAGALNICSLLTSPLNSGVFDKAIMQSGACPMELRQLKQTSSNGRTGRFDGGLLNGNDGQESAEELGLEAERALGCNRNADPLDCMRSLPPETIFSTLNAGDFQPIIDGYLLPELPGEVFRQGGQIHVPLLVGSNENEMGILRSINSIVARSVRSYERRVESLFGDDTDGVLAYYPATNRSEALAAYEALTTDLAFTCSARRAAMGMSQFTSEPVWRYLFSALTPGYEDQGAVHGSEIPFVFGNLDFAEYTASDEVLSSSMRTYWGNFARTGNPNGTDLVDWDQFTLSLEDYQELDQTVEAGVLYKADECEFLDSILYP